MAQVGHLNELHKKYFDKGLRIVAISAEPMNLITSKVVEERGAEYWMASDPGRETMAQFTQSGRIGIPHAYLVDASGKVVSEGFPSEGTIESLLADTFDPSLGRELAGPLKSIVAQYEKGQIGKAWAAAERYASGEDAEVARDAAFLRERAEAYAGFVRKLAEGSIEGKDYVTAFDDLDRIAKDFAGMEVATWAAETKKTLEADPVVKDEIKAWKLFEKIQKDEAKAGGKEKKLKPVATKYARLAKKYPETRAGKMAEEAAKRLGG